MRTAGNVIVATGLAGGTIFLGPIALVAGVTVKGVAVVGVAVVGTKIATNCQSGWI